MKLDAELIEGFVNSLLINKFDKPVKTPACHKEWWQLCCSDDKYIAIAAPRKHAKSTSITFSYLLASVLFRQHKFVILVSDTETQATLFLGDIKQQLIENEDLIKLFGVKKFVKLAETDIIVEMEDGYKFRIIAKGSEQKLRGIKWSNMRPDLIICHKLDTDIYTPETGWIKNQNYPNAKLIHTHSAYEVEYEDGTKEIVSEDHRYLTDKGWKFIWEMKATENVVENITDDIMNDILKKEKNLLKNITISKKLKIVLGNGWKAIWIAILLLRNNGKLGIKNTIINKLKSIARVILDSQLRVVQKGGQEN